jgi:hypothetical protein
MTAQTKSRSKPRSLGRGQILWGSQPPPEGMLEVFWEDGPYFLPWPWKPRYSGGPEDLVLVSAVSGIDIPAWSNLLAT